MLVWDNNGSKKISVFSSFSILDLSPGHSDRGLRCPIVWNIMMSFDSLVKVEGRRGSSKGGHPSDVKVTKKQSEYRVINETRIKLNNTLQTVRTVTSLTKQGNKRKILKGRWVKMTSGRHKGTGRLCWVLVEEVFRPSKCVIGFSVC